MPAYGGCFISTYALLDLPLEQAVLRLIDGGWKAIEIMCEGPHGELLEWPAERLSWLREIGEANGIAWTIHAPIAGCNPAAVDDDAIRASGSVLLRTMRIAHMLGCAYVVVHPGEQAEPVNGHDAADFEEAAQRVAAFLRDALQASRKSQVAIALENVPPYPGLLGTDAAFLQRVLQLAPSPRLGIVFDAGHAHLTGPGRCLSALRALLPDVIAVHLSDNRGELDDHMLLGTGTVPLEETVALTQQFRYSGAWVLEMRSVPDAIASAAWLGRRFVQAEAPPGRFA